MTPSGTLVLRPAGAVEHPEDPQMPLEESTMPDRHDKNIEKVFPVFGHRFVAKVGRNIQKKKISSFSRPSTSLSTVQWTEISSGVSENRLNPLQQHP